MTTTHPNSDQGQNLENRLNDRLEKLAGTKEVTFFDGRIPGFDTFKDIIDDGQVYKEVVEFNSQVQSEVYGNIPEKVKASVANIASLAESVQRTLSEANFELATPRYHSSGGGIIYDTQKNNTNLVEANILESLTYTEGLIAGYNTLREALSQSTISQRMDLLNNSLTNPNIPEYSLSKEFKDEFSRLYRKVSELTIRMKTVPNTIKELTTLVQQIQGKKEYTSNESIDEEIVALAKAELLTDSKILYVEDELVVRETVKEILEICKIGDKMLGSDRIMEAPDGEIGLRKYIATRFNLSDSDASKLDFSKSNGTVGYEFNGQKFTDAHKFAEYLRENNFQENPLAFALVITDVKMPSMGGDILAQEIRKFDKRIPIIVTTGYEENNGIYHNNNVKVIRKPLDFKELMKTVSTVYGHK